METKLKIVVQERGIKGTWLADKVGISNGTLSNLINGKSEPTLRTARKIARVLGMTIEELWPEDEENQPV